MKVTELTRDELIELKQRYLMEQREEAHEDEPSYGELSAIDELVTDEEVYQEYADVDFVEEDFFGNI